MGPRMERLRAIEQDIKSRVEEWALAEEKTEVNNIVPVFVTYWTSVVCTFMCKMCEAGQSTDDADTVWSYILQRMRGKYESREF